MNDSPAKQENASPFDIVIGLEVHVQLSTNSKLFCGCSTQFGAEPNTQTCPVCLGLPGSLPVMNREAFRLSMRTALALNCEIPKFTKWDRKQYHYPDLPKGYQISQFELPMSQHGHLAIRDAKDRFEPKNVRITRAHLEEDAGKSMHDEAAGKGDSRIDLNRTGTPLLEIVSEPDMRSPEEARAYLDELKLLLTYLGVSDCNMQEGSLRVDANVNLHVREDEQTMATPIVEIKNMNSFRAVERALAYEANRQWEIWQESRQKLGDVPKQTRGWDDQAEVTTAQRSKEESSDYRYFPDPDLVPVKVTDAEIDEVKASLGELPADLRIRLVESIGLPEYDSDVLVNQGPALVNYFLQAAEQGGDAKQASNWVQRDVLRHLKESDSSIADFGVTAVALGQLIATVKSGSLDNSRASEVFEAMLANGSDVAAAMDSLGIKQVSSDDLRDLCKKLLDANPQVVDDVKNGKQRAIGSLIGQAKKENPNANPGDVRKICLELIQAMDA